MKKFIYILGLVLGLNPITSFANERVAVVELFTSQGCSSCPPADAFLGELAVRDDVLALAYHVDYWDYIGWDDVHAQAAFTERQRTYARTFNLRYVYTPQVVVSGGYETSGNKRDNIIKAVERELSGPSDISLTSKNDSIEVDGPVQDSDVGVFRVSFHKEVSTKVKRGENRGKTLTNYHIVRKLDYLGNWTGGGQSYQTKALSPEMGHAVFLQRKNDLKILSAIRLP